MIEIVSKILENYKDDGSLIKILQQIQNDLGYVPKEAVDEVSRKTGVSPSQIYGILTFYSQFRLTPPGKHTLKVCLGTACHIMGGHEIFEHLKRKFKIMDNETTEDRLFTLTKVRCLGCCGMAPVIMVDDKIYGRMDISKTERLIDDLR
ncbi:NAD(P)H-dependent oxidoreductase subunit E [Archaeoglobales archaeon]|nr:MAG: NAD(P)H-dependent oxidoreductase subunit E [Archaeoglobales archaeon]